MIFELVDHFKILKSARSVVFVGREIGPKGKVKHYFLVDDFYPYMGVPWAERNKAIDEYGFIRIEKSQDIRGVKLAKIILKRADDVSTIRDKFTTTYESNVLFHNRVKIDIGIKSKFEIPDDDIKGLCIACGKSKIKYHKISHTRIIGN